MVQRVLLSIAVVFALACGGAPPPTSVTSGRAPYASMQCAAASPTTEAASPVTGPAATSAELAALVHEHRPAGGPPALDPRGEVSVPLDWRALAMTAELPPLPRSGTRVLAGDVVVMSADGALVGWDARVGTERWRSNWETTMPGTLLAGCGRVIAVGSREIVGLDPATGARAWSLDLVSDASTMVTPLGGVELRGCHLVFQCSDHELGLVDPFRSSRLRVMDVTSGAISARPECDTLCRAESLETEGVIVAEEGSRWLYGYDGESRAALPADARLLTATTAVSIDGNRLRGTTRMTGDVAWERTIDCGSGFYAHTVMLLARVDDDVVTLDGSALVRLSLDTGEERWRLLLSDEVASGIRRRDGTASDAHRLLVGCRVEPQFLLDVDLDAGAVRSLRISSVDPVDIDLSGDLALVTSHRTQAVVDLTLDAPPMRERLSMDADIARAIDTLGSTRPHDSIEGPPWLYPQSRSDALAWLERLRPIVGDVVSSRIASSDVGEAADLLAALEGTDAAMPAALGVLRRTYCPPDPPRVHARARAAAALTSPLSDADADALALETIAWMDAALGGPPDESLWDAILAGRDALLRTAPHRSTLRVFEDAVARHAPTRVAHDCTPSEDDAVRAAVLRYGYEFATTLDAEILVPGSSCIRVQTLGGPLVVSAAETTDARPYVTVGPASSLTSDHAELPLPWPDAPARLVTFTWYRDPLAAQGEELIVQRVDDEWRVVWQRTTWVS